MDFFAEMTSAPHVDAQASDYMPDSSIHTKRSGKANPFATAYAENPPLIDMVMERAESHRSAQNKNYLLSESVDFGTAPAKAQFFQDGNRSFQESEAGGDTSRAYAFDPDFDPFAEVLDGPNNDIDKKQIEIE